MIPWPISKRTCDEKYRNTGLNSDDFGLRRPPVIHKTIMAKNVLPLSSYMARVNKWYFLAGGGFVAPPFRCLDVSLFLFIVLEFFGLNVFCLRFVRILDVFGCLFVVLIFLFVCLAVVDVCSCSRRLLQNASNLP